MSQRVLRLLRAAALAAIFSAAVGLAACVAAEPPIHLDDFYVGTATTIGEAGLGSGRKDRTLSIEDGVLTDDFDPFAVPIYEIAPSGDVGPPSTPQPAAAALASPRDETALRDKWDLWSGSTTLRGANIWQKRVSRDDAMGDGPVGPPYSQQDLDHLAAWGANYVNVSHPGIFTEKGEYHFDAGVFENLTELIDKAQRAGLFVVVAYRTGPGRNEAVFGGEQEKKLDAIWSSQTAREAWGQMWRETARRLKDRSVVIGYDLMVEPETKNHRLWNEMARNITRDIREVDSQTPILVGAADWSTVDSLDSLQLTGDPRTVYVVHQYEPYAYSHQKRKGSAYSPEKLEEVYRKLREFKSRQQVPLAVNEFGAVRYAPGVERFVEDQMRQLETLGANHALWLWETSFRLNYDQFNFRHGPDRSHHADVPTSPLIEVIKRNWSLNRIRPGHLPETP